MQEYIKTILKAHYMRKSNPKFITKNHFVKFNLSNKVKFKLLYLKPLEIYNIVLMTISTKTIKSVKYLKRQNLTLEKRKKSVLYLKH